MMAETKKYPLYEDVTSVVKEPVVAYGIHREVFSTPMPCCFTEEEFREEIRLSEASGYASDAEIEAMYVKWGV